MRVYFQGGVWTNFLLIYLKKSEGGCDACVKKTHPLLRGWIAWLRSICLIRVWLVAALRYVEKGLNVLSRKLI